jgi:hypothetical protein
MITRNWPESHNDPFSVAVTIFLKTSKWALVFSISMSIVFYFAACHVAPYAVLQPHRLSRAEIAEMFSYRVPKDYGLQSEPLEVAVDDSTRLSGWFLHTDADTAKGTIIVLHGIASCKEAMLPLAAKLCRNHFNVVLFDLRAHGESGGRYCTYGYREKFDVVVLIDTLLARYPSAGPLALFGNSLGAAVALQTMAVEPRISCAVVESPFATLREIASDYLAQYILIRWRRLSDSALDEAGRIARFPVDSVRPEESARAIARPVLLAHGTQDRNVSVSYGRRVFDNLQSPFKELYEIPDGDHYNLAAAGGAAYERTMLSFLDRHCRK